MLAHRPQDPGGLMESETSDGEPGGAAQHGLPSFVRPFDRRDAAVGTGMNRGASKPNATLRCALRSAISRLLNSSMHDEPKSCVGRSGSTRIHANLLRCVEPTSTA